MKIAFLHYHLKTGGVTTVLKRQVSALKGRCEMLVLTGDRAETVLPCPVVEISELGYDRPDVLSPAPKTIVEKVLQAIRHVWPGGCDVLHLHNPTLAKNQHVLQCIRLLQNAGVKLFLQIHDFAEDGRPGVYSREPYPSDCHYGVINTRDKGILVASGLQPSGVHLIPNPIQPLPVVTGNFPDGLVLYPVRAIRRKNIGEAILLSMFLRPDQYLGITQPPNSQQDMESFQDWQAFVNENRLRVHFNMGQQHDFADLVGGASSIITTSITEGFGFSFLEPWTANKMLQGRRVKEICKDYEKKGLCLDSLYDTLEVPLEWFQVNDFFQTWQRTVLHAAKNYHYSIDPKSLHQYITLLNNGGVIDFGILNERFQRQVILYLLSSPEAMGQLAIRNPRLIFPVPEEGAGKIIENNRRVVALHYGMEMCREQLLSIYKKVVHRPVRQRVDKQVLVDAFFDPDRFSLLKWGAYEG